jgi:RNA polymerase sigma factor (sigma-70 family)
MNTENHLNKNIDDKNSNYYLLGIKENNTKVIYQIYEQLSGRVSKMVISNQGSSQQAKDVFQDVLVSIYVQAQSGLEIHCSFSYFFLLACKRRWLNILNSKYNQVTDSIEEVALNLTTINEGVNTFFEENEKIEFMRQKLNMLDPMCKEIITLSWQSNDQGKYNTWDDVARELDVSYGYVRKKAAGCKQRLLELVQKDYRYREFL